MKHDTQPPAQLVLGLHITKCAGTSFVSTVRRHLTEDCYYFCSSYYENWLAGRPLLEEIPVRDRLEVVFGHFCHEHLISVFKERKIVLVTGLRDPLKRAISHFRQLNAVHHAAGLPLPRAYQFLMHNPNSMCAEILRCFPSIDRASDEPRWTKAAGALSLFDYLYSTENFTEDAGTLLEFIHIRPDELITDNISDEKDIPDDVNRLIDDQIKIIEKEFLEYYDQDIELYEVMRPYLSRKDLQKEGVFDGQSWQIKRPEYLAKLAPEAEALRAFADHERYHITFEFRTMGLVPQLIRSIDERIAGWQRLRDLVAGPAQKTSNNSDSGSPAGSPQRSRHRG